MSVDIAMLQPVVALMIWTMIMWAWMYATRIPAMTKANIAPGDAAVPRKLDRALPDSVQAKAHNYNHLHEQPTLFYAISLLLALVAAPVEITHLLAWIYVGLRVIHSLVQATANKVMVRFILFLLSSVVLIVLIFDAAMAVF